MRSYVCMEIAGFLFSFVQEQELFFLALVLLDLTKSFNSLSKSAMYLQTFVLFFF